MSLILEVDHNVTYVKGQLHGELYKGLKRELGYLPEDSFWMKKKHSKDSKQKWKQEWDGIITAVCWNKKFCKCHIKKDGMHFHTGLVNRACEYFKNNNIEYKIVDIRKKTEKTNRYSMSNEFEYRDYQQEIIDKVIGKDGKRGIDRGIIKSATGSGKTSIACSIIANIGVSPTIFYVTSIDLLKQAKDEIERFIIENGQSVDVGVVGGGHKEIKDITVMTVQTAVRALGGVWIKYDDEDFSKDDTDINDIKDNIKNLIQDCRLMICDEVQHWSAETCQIISDNSVNCQYRYGFSATPYRDKGDDILIDACFGKCLADINASYLIKRGYLVRPNIFFWTINNMRGIGKVPYQTLYKMAIVENHERNDIVKTTANHFLKQGRKILILVRQIEHGKFLESMIDGSVFLYGKTSKKKREKHLNLMREGSPQITIASSLPYDEFIFIKNKEEIKQIEIGDLCENYEKEIENGEIFAVCSFDGKKRSWGKIIKGHKHKRENRIVYVKTNKNENIYVTENHSLVDSNLNKISPSTNEVACVPYGSIERKKINEEIDIIELFKNIDDPSLEIEIFGITQGKIRSLKKQLEYLHDEKKVSKSTRLKYRKLLKNYNKEEYKKVLILFFKYFRYYKFRFRAKLKDVINSKIIFKYFKAKIFIRRSRKNIYLPIKLPITKSLALISGLMCGDGHIKNHSCGKSIYINCFAGLEDMEKSVEGKHDINKKNIRKIFKEKFNEVFKGVVIEGNDKQLRFNGKLLYYLFKELGHIDRNGDKTIPFYIYNSHRDIQENFLYGLYLSDGCKKYNTKGNRLKDEIGAIVITNTSRPLVSGLSFLLKNLEIDFYCEYREKRNKKWKNIYYISICSDFASIKLKRIVSKIHMDYVDRVQKEVEILDSRDDKYVYDISVEGCHNFIAGVGGVLAHNTIFDEGIDCKPLNTLILAGGGKSQTRALQRIGRILRKFEGKEDAIVVDFMDNCKYLQSHSQKREKIYKSESEFIIKRQK